jgi:hypothetical protein
MRIEHFKKRLEILKNEVEIKDTISKSGNVDYHTISNWNTVYASLCELNSYSFLTPMVQEIFKLGIQYESYTSTIRIDANAFNQFNARYKPLISVLNSVNEMLDEFFGADSIDQINVKLPDNIDLTALSEMIKDIDFIFNKAQAVRKFNDNKDVTIKRIDSGSIWLILSISAGAVTLIGKLVKMALNIKEQQVENEIAVQRLRVAKSGANIIEQIEKELKEKLIEDCHTQAENFAQDNNCELNYEEQSSLSKATERLASLLFKGIEIYASLEAPKEVALEFPKQEVVERLTERSTKQLPGT